MADSIKRAPDTAHGFRAVGRTLWLIPIVAAILVGGSGAWTAEAAVVPGRSSLPPPDPVGNSVSPQDEYRIGPLDTLEITVFGVDNLKRTLQVDAAGQINFPLIGAVPASPKTPLQLSDELAQRLGQKYLQSPQVTVFVTKSMSQKFTVEGAVKESGVFDLYGRTTLLQAIAMARGVEDNATLRKVVVFRVIERRRVAAVINLSDVRSGKVEDPQIYAGDIIVVPSSSSDRILRRIIGVTPLLMVLGL
jgi:polysaccharide export outer membrane protein